MQDQDEVGQVGNPVGGTDRIPVARDQVQYPAIAIGAQQGEYAGAGTVLA
jgi:hypothetical protein